MLREETAASPALAAAALAGLQAYQAAPRRPPPPAPPTIARAGRARLLDYGGAGPPLVVVPSLVNPAAILDLTEERSLLRWLSRQGVRPLLVDWGEPTPADRDVDVGSQVASLLLALLDAVGERPLLAGYCLGGTMALAAAAIRPARGVALIATPWRFGRYPASSRAAIGALWAAARPVAERLGLLPMEALQAGFWQLDPAGTIAKYARFPGLDAEAQARFVALEDWANAGAPLTLGAARELFDGFVAGDVTGRRRWRVAGHTVVPGRLRCPILNIVSAADRIVPAASAAAAGERRTLSLGHVGMVVGGGAPDALWRPLARWLSGVTAPR